MYDSIATAVAVYRARRRITQDQLAIALGWHQQQVSRLERGRDHNLTLTTLRDLSRTLGLIFVIRDGEVRIHEDLTVPGFE